MNDIAREIEAINRTIGSRRIPAGEGCSDPDRLKRWFSPVSGDLRVGGTFQIEGNARGEILRCQPPRLLTISWVYGDNPADEVELRLTTEAGGATTVELEHAAAPGRPEDLAGVGVGWDLTLFGLGMHLAGQAAPDPAELERSPEYRRFVVLSSTAWGAALETAGVATAEEAAAVVERTSAFYAPTRAGTPSGAAATSGGGGPGR
jgi:hypothetical protein